jgi:hypothetical protein
VVLGRRSTLISTQNPTAKSMGKSMAKPMANSTVSPDGSTAKPTATTATVNATITATNNDAMPSLGGAVGIDGTVGGVASASRTSGIGGLDLAGGVSGVGMAITTEMLERFYELSSPLVSQVP